MRPEHRRTLDAVRRAALDESDEGPTWTQIKHLCRALGANVVLKQGHPNWFLVRELRGRSAWLGSKVTGPQPTRVEMRHVHRLFVAAGVYDEV